jgi:UV excision repair protein RAD23
VLCLQGIPETAEVAVPVARFPADQATETGAAPAAPAPAFGAPNSSPLNMFPEVKLHILEGFHYVLTV